MKRLFVTGSLLALLAACNSQTEETVPTDPVAPAADDVPAVTEASEAPAAGDAGGAAFADLAKGAMLEATKTTQCRETGANAGEPPWDVGVGSFAKFVAVEGADVRVELAGSECLIPADAVKPSAN